MSSGSKYKKYIEGLQHRVKSGFRQMPTNATQLSQILFQYVTTLLLKQCLKKTARMAI